MRGQVTARPPGKQAPHFSDIYYQYLYHTPRSRPLMLIQVQRMGLDVNLLQTRQVLVRQAHIRELASYSVSRLASQNIQLYMW